MAGFLYLLPTGQAGLVREDAVAAGLGYAFEKEGIATCTVTAGKGPGGVGGVLLADEKRLSGQRVGLDLQRQQWNRIPGSEAWCGFFTDAPPVPAELAREKMINGQFVELGDGHDWLIPVARGLQETAGTVSGFNALPQGRELNGDGKWKAGGVIERYRPLWAVAERVWDELTSGASDKEDSDRDAMDYQQTTEAVVTVLATNYCVGPAEVSMLGLLSDENVNECLRALIDWATWIEWLKKKVLEPPSEAPAS